jgi:hypothetical protein
MTAPVQTEGAGDRESPRTASGRLRTPAHCSLTPDLVSGLLAGEPVMGVARRAFVPTCR